ncbi:MAG TPA: ComEC/Rec2 family competence protein [Chloroflexota bacterium]
MTLLLLAAAWLIGSAVGLLATPPSTALSLAALAGGGALLGWDRVALRWSGLLTAVALLASLRAAPTTPLMIPVEPPAETITATVRGVVAAPPQRDDRWTTFPIEVEEVVVPAGFDPSLQRALVRLPRARIAPSYGDRVEVRGRLRPTQDVPGYPEARLLRRQGVGHVFESPRIVTLGTGGGHPLLSALHGVRQHVEARLRAVLPEPHASYLVGLLVGLRGGLPDSFRDDLQRSGASHLVAVSGYNITVVAGIAAGASRSLGPLPSAVVALLSILTYTLLAGAPPSAVRAAIMGGALVVAQALGRPRDGLTWLLVAAAVMVAADPPVLLDLGFQLSFLATGGLLAFARPIARRLAPLPGAVAEPLASTLAAQLAVTPLLATVFPRLSLVAPLANVPLVALLPPTMLLGAITALTASVATPLAAPVAWVAWALLEASVEIVRFAARLPGASLATGLLPAEAAVGCYLALLIGAVAISPDAQQIREALGHLAQRTAPLLVRVPRGRPLGVAMAGLVALGILGHSALAARGDGRLHVAFLDVGHGYAAWVRTPAGHTLLVDGGPSGPVLNALVAERLAFFERKIGIVALTAAKEPHAAGLVELLDRYDVGLAVAPSGVGGGSAQRWRTALDRRGVPVLDGADGLALQFDDGTMVEIYTVAAPEGDAREEAVVLRVLYGDVAVLFAGGLDPEHRPPLLARGLDLRSVVLQVPGHGSRESVDDRLLAAVSPRFAVVPVDARNRYGHPSAEALALLAGTSLYRTDLHGTVDVVVACPNPPAIPGDADVDCTVEVHPQRG